MTLRWPTYFSVYACMIIQAVQSAGNHKVMFGTELHNAGISQADFIFFSYFPAKWWVMTSTSVHARSPTDVLYRSLLICNYSWLQTCGGKSGQCVFQTFPKLTATFSQQTTHWPSSFSSCALVSKQGRGDICIWWYRVVQNSEGLHFPLWLINNLLSLKRGFTIFIHVFKVERSEHQNNLILCTLVCETWVIFKDMNCWNFAKQLLETLPVSTKHHKLLSWVIKSLWYGGWSLRTHLALNHSWMT